MMTMATDFTTRLSLPLIAAPMTGAASIGMKRAQGSGERLVANSERAPHRRMRCPEQHERVNARDGTS